MPGPVIIGEGLVQQHEINIIGFQLAHGFQHGGPAGVVTVMLHPHLGGKE